MLMYSIGSDVRVGGRTVKIIGAAIREGGPKSYEVVWWDGASRKCEWIDPIEIEQGSAERQTRIGFTASKQGTQ